MVFSLHMHGFNPLIFNSFGGISSPFGIAVLGVLLPIIILVAIWTIVLKGFALWYSARAGQKWWFVALLVINTLGILEIIYLLWYRPKESAPVSSSSAS